MKKRALIIAVALIMCVVLLSSCDQIPSVLGDVVDEIGIEVTISDIISTLFGNGQSSEGDEGVNEKNDELNVNLYKIDPRNGQYLTIDNGMLFNDVLWEPGMAHRLNLVVSNEDVLACQYKIFLLEPNAKDQSMSETAEFIEVYVCNPEIDLDRNMLNSSSEYYVGTLKEVFNRSIDSGYLMPWERGYFTIILKMREDASNEFSVNMPCFVCVHVDATPVEKENDVFGNAYDDN